MANRPERSPRSESPIFYMELSEPPDAADTSSSKAKKSHNDASFAYIGAGAQLESASAVAVNTPGNRTMTIDTIIASHPPHAAGFSDYLVATLVADDLYKQVIQRRYLQRWIARTLRRHEQRA
ncbi:MAG: hypothetical protein Q9214_002235 [Letrouitia sp. 1 TL-2023]